MTPVAPPANASRRVEQSGYLTRPVYQAATALQDRPTMAGGSVYSSGYNAFNITTQDVLEVLGPDADDLLATANLDVDELISMINAETTMLPRIDEELEAMFAAESAPEPEFGLDEPQPEKTAESIGKRWKKRFLKAAIGAILLSSTGGAAMAVAMDKDVTIDVDGQDQHIRTYDQTVGQVLASQGITVGMHDSLSPSPNASVSDGGQIVLDRGRLLRVVVDGVEQDHWTQANTVSAAMSSLGITAPAGSWMSANGNSNIPLNGMMLQVRTPKAVTLINGANTPMQLTTTAATVGDLLAAQHISLGTSDSVDPGISAQITPGMQILVSRQGVSVIQVTETIQAPVQTIQDPTMNEGTQQITTPGVNGTQVVTYRVTTVNGKQTQKVQINSVVTKQAVAEVIHQGTKQLPGDAVWDEIAQCESGGDWSIDTGNGYYGGLQFNEPTWLSNGGAQYAQYPNQATKAQQIAVADRVRAARGLEPWQCAGELGLD